MQNTRILIVDDDAILAARLEETLLQLGYQTAGMAATGKAAVEMALTQKPDAILMDIRLRGEMTGIQAAEEIHRSADIPVIYLTAYTEENLVRQASITDAYAYLAKPVRDRELRASLEMALYKHAMEKRLQHLNQVLRAVRDINQLITRQHDVQRLLDEACRILVQTRGYRLVWIGKTMLEDRLVHPIAWAGEEAGYLDQVEISWDENPTRQEPSGVAIREKQPVVCHDLAADPELLPWHESILEHGILSLAAIPIEQEQRLVNVLSVYGDRTDLFGDEEVDLLDEVAHDLAFALVALEEEAARKRAEVEILRLSSFPRLNPNPVLEVDEKGAITFMNQAASVLLESSVPPGEPTILLPQDLGDFLERLAKGETDLHYREVAVGNRILGEDIHLLPEFGVIRIYAREITRNKQAEAALRDSEERYRSLVEQASDGIFITDLNGNYIDVNNRGCEMFGYTRDEILHFNVSDLVAPDDLSKTPLHIDELRAGKTMLFERRMVHKDGKLLPVEISSKLLSGGRLQGIHRDINERKQTEGALKEIEERYHELFVQMLAAFALHEIICDENNRAIDYRFLDVNPAFELMTGLKRDEVIGKTAVEIFPQIEPSWIERYGRVALTGEPCHFEQFFPPLGKCYEISAFSPQIGRFAVTFTDITTSKQAGERQRQAEESYRAIFDNAPVGIFQTTPEGSYLKANQALADIYGYASPEEMMAKVTDITNQLYWDPAERQYFQRILAEFGEIHGDEVRNRHKDGSMFWITRSVRSVKNAAGEILYYEGFLQDISERKRVEEALQNSEQQYRDIFEGVQDAIFVESPTGEILDVNQRACEMYGFTHEQFLSMKVNDLVSPGSKVVLACDDQNAGITASFFESENLRANGERFPIELSCRLQNLGGNSLMLVVVRDITERKRAEEALRAALREKEVLLRELYHRTKNNMQVISALLNMEADRSEDAALQKTLRDMDTRILAMALVHEKLYQSKNLAHIDLKDYITNLAALILESYDVRTEKVRFSIDADSVTIPIESAIPCGLLVNEIISNSLKHAFPGKRTGEIKIRLSRLEQSAVLLEISDNGIGVPAEIDLHNRKSLGMRIIFGIAGHQLHAQVQVNTSSGVAWRIRIPDLAEQQGRETLHLQ
jgi:PAS domain S-box-containing protein